MQSKFVICAIAVASLACTACAGVKFERYAEVTEDNKKTTKLISTGFPVYTSKPYLLVSRTGAKDKPVEVSVIYLPDRSEAGTIYTSFDHGLLGSSNLTMSLSNGQLVSLGQQTDTKLPELLNSVSGMITAQAGADKLGAEAISLLKGTDEKGFIEQDTSAFGKLGQFVSKVATDIQKYLGPGMPHRPELRVEEPDRIDKAISELNLAANDLRSAASPSEAAKAIMRVRSQADVLSKFNKAGSAGTPRDEALTAVDLWASQLRAALAEAVPSLSKPEFELWEILPGGGLKPVDWNGEG